MVIYGFSATLGTDYESYGLHLSHTKKNGENQVTGLEEEGPRSDLETVYSAVDRTMRFYQYFK